MSNRTAVQDTPFRFQRSVHLLGSGLCSLLVLAACSPMTRSFEDGGGGTGAGTGASSSGTGASSSSSSGSVSCDNPDPECECVDGALVARDTDGDGQGSRLCEAAPGTDCDDGDAAFQQNACGGCNKNIGGVVGDPCGECGFFECQGDSAVQCATPTPPPMQCSGNTVQVCSGAQWVDDKTCSGATPACYMGACKECIPGSFKCGSITYPNDIIIKCLDTGSWESSWTASCYQPSECVEGQNTCAGLFFHPRDVDFDVPSPHVAPGLPAPPGAPGPGLPTRDVLDLAVGIAFA
jgi:hypothetical protein